VVFLTGKCPSKTPQLPPHHGNSQRPKKAAEPGNAMADWNIPKGCGEGHGDFVNLWDELFAHVLGKTFSCQGTNETGRRGKSGFDVKKNRIGSNILSQGRNGMGLWRVKNLLPADGFALMIQENHRADQSSLTAGLDMGLSKK
jgi:hypothetical protein